MLAIEHQNRLCHPWQEIELVCFGKGPGHAHTANIEYNGFDSFFDSWHDASHKAAPTPAEVTEFVILNIRAGLKIIKGTSYVFTPHDHMVFVENGFLLQVRFDIIMTFVCPLVDRPYKCPATLEYKINAPIDVVRIVYFGKQVARTREEKHRLIGWLDTFRQVEIQQHPVIIVACIKSDFFYGPVFPVKCSLRLFIQRGFVIIILGEVYAKSVIIDWLFLTIVPESSLE